VAPKYKFRLKNGKNDVWGAPSTKTVPPSKKVSHMKIDQLGSAIVRQRSGDDRLVNEGARWR